MNPDAIQEARRGVAWALLLSLAILAGIVALLAGFTLVRLAPYAPLLMSASDPVTLPSGQQVHPGLFRTAIPALAISLGLLVASVGSLRRLGADSSRTPAPPAAKPVSRSTRSGQPRKRRR
ncbi:hypothetical protein [uncultured Meiothermus sp.]|jgi:hypothetical protein|uniref:hypothetical protein n=1 Tax=uncultured Meiothermus sp. TaxID=157471 RepID=UPI00262E5264|nr:hypothetical protein [uncultured Meiothermus sp.]